MASKVWRVTSRMNTMITGEPDRVLICFDTSTIQILKVFGSTFTETLKFNTSVS